MQTPRRWGLPFSAGVLALAALSLRPLRTSCWIVGTASPFSSVGGLRIFVGGWSSSVAVVVVGCSSDVPERPTFLPYGPPARRERSLSLHRVRPSLSGPRGRVCRPIRPCFIPLLNGRVETRSAEVASCALINQLTLAHTRMPGAPQARGRRLPARPR